MTMKQTVLSLMQVDADPAISLFLPIETEPHREKRNEIRLRKLFKQAEAELTARGVEDGPALIAKAREALAARRLFEGPAHKGAALFFARNDFRLLPLPYDPGALVSVDDHYQIRPLLPLIELDDRFFILTIDQDNPALLAADRFSVQPYKSKLMEDSLAAIKGRTALPADVGFHPAGGGGPGGGGRPAARYHAQGDSPADYRQIELDRYALGVAHAADHALADQQAPLVMAGDPNLLGMVRKHLRYPRLMRKAIDKSPAGLEDGALRRMAWAIVADDLQRPRRKALDRLCAAYERGDKTVALNPENVLKSAREGRVDALLLAEGTKLPAHLAQPNGGDGVFEGRKVADLTDHMARETLCHGGAVYIVPPSALPHGSPTAAMLRY